MKIKRTIGGVEHEIELTEEELSEAYTEVQHQFDCDDVSDVLTSMLGNDDIDGYDPMPDETELYKLISHMAEHMRRDMDKNATEWWDFAEDAIRDVLREVYGEPT